MNRQTNRPAATVGLDASAPADARRSRSVEIEGGRTLHILGRYGLVMLLAAVLVTFSIWKPGSFFAWDNFKATFAQQAIIVMVALAAMMPLIVGEFDLSVGANAGFASIFAVGLSYKQGLNPWLAIMVA